MGNLQYKNAIASGDNRAAVMNVGVGVRGVALPQLRSVVFSYHASRFLPRVVLLSHHALLVIASRVSQTHVGIYNTETQSLTDDNRAAVMNVAVGVGGVALPLLQRRVFLPRVVLLSHHALLVIASRVSQTHVGIYNTETQSRNGDNHAVMMNVGGVALPLLRSVVFSYHASRFLPRVVFSYHASRFLPRVVLLITRCWFLLRECHRHMWEFTTQKRNRAAVTIAQR